VAGQAQRGHAGLRPPRILILSASIGAGHDLPAEVMAEELRELEPAVAVKVLDTVKEAGPILEAFVDSGSLFHSHWGNVVFDLQHRAMMQWGPGRRAMTRTVMRLARRRIISVVERERPDVIVSTWPGGTEILGRLRLTGELTVPVVSAITDLASLWWWAQEGVDVHLVTHVESSAEIHEIAGPDAVIEHVRGLDDPAWVQPLAEDDARRALGLPVEPKLVVVSGGGWGVGDLEGAIRTAAADGDTLVVCITGRNEALRERLEQRFGANEQVRVLGFTEQMSDWMAAADAMIHATAGLTVLEAHIRGCPVVSYGFSAGHLRANNAAFERFGLAEVARSEHELESVLRHVTRERQSPDSSFASLPSIASRALEVRPRVKQQPVWRVRTERVAAAVTVMAVLVVMILSVVKTENPYKVVSTPLKGHIHIITDEDKAAASSSATEAAQSQHPAPSSTAAAR